MHCSLGPAATADSRTGVPDGNPVPSFSLDHRAVYTLRPSATGNIIFALAPGPYGAVCLREGSCNVMVPMQDGTTLGTSTNVLATIAGDSSFPQLPFPTLPTSFGTKTFGQYNVTAWRHITTVAEVAYTGSSMMDQGYAVTSNVNIFPNMTTQTLSIGPNVVTRYEVNPPMVQTRPDSVVGPAKKSIEMKILPSNYDYQPIWADAVLATGGGTMILNPVVLSGATQTTFPTPGIASGTVKLYMASGLDPSASITVSVRTCVEYQVSAQFSAMAPFTRPSPPTDHAAIALVRDTARSLPAATWIDYGKQALRIGGAMASAYGSKSVAPLLALMNHH